MSLKSILTLIAIMMVCPLGALADFPTGLFHVTTENCAQKFTHVSLHRDFQNSDQSVLLLTNSANNNSNVSVANFDFESIQNNESKVEDGMYHWALKTNQPRSLKKTDEGFIYRLNEKCSYLLKVASL